MFSPHWKQATASKEILSKDNTQPKTTSVKFLRKLLSGKREEERVFYRNILAKTLLSVKTKASEISFSSSPAPTCISNTYNSNVCSQT